MTKKTIKSRNEKIFQLLNEVVFPCCYGVYLLSERPALEGVHAYFCAKEMWEILENKNLVFTKEKRQAF